MFEENLIDFAMKNNIKLTIVSIIKIGICFL